MMKVLHERPSSDYLRRITGVNGTHQVLYNALINEQKIVSTNGRAFSGRESNWHWRFTGSYDDCLWYINSKS
jgi:hypothetical protein